MTRVLMLLPSGPHVGLKATTYAISQFFSSQGMRIRIFRPIHQPGVQQKADPGAMPLSTATSLYAKGHHESLMDDIVGQLYANQDPVDCIIIPGLHQGEDQSVTQAINKKIALALNASIVIVTSGHDESADHLTERVESSQQFISYRGKHRVVGCIINKAKPLIIDSDMQIRHDLKVPLIAMIPWQDELASMRLSDVIAPLQARIFHDGAENSARIQRTTLCARGVDNMVDALQPGTLIITASDRSDILLASATAVANGTALAGLLLTGGQEPHPAIYRLIQPLIASSLPILLTDYDSFTTTMHLQNMAYHIHDDDHFMKKQAGNKLAPYFDSKWLDTWLSGQYTPQLTPAAFCYQLAERAKQQPKKILLPEGEEPRIIEAAIEAYQRQVARPILLGRRQVILDTVDNMGLKWNEHIIIMDPDEQRVRFIDPLVRMRSHKGMDQHIAAAQLEDPIILGTMMLAMDEVDGLVAGAITTTANTIRPALQLIKTTAGTPMVSSCFFMCLPSQVMVYADCAMNPNPDAESLAYIAKATAASAVQFGLSPVVAMLSYATGTSGQGIAVDKVVAATTIIRELSPDLQVDGPLQYDAAINPSVAAKKAPNSPVAGSANILIFPDLNTGNTTYKAVQRSTDALCIGPMLQGLRRPVNDLSRGASVEDILFTIMITAIQAQTNSTSA